MLSPPYKNEFNQWYTSALFHENLVNISVEQRPFPKAVFTLQEDKPGYINARKTFVELGDPTGYAWSMKYLKDYNHWILLMKSKWFREAHEIWMNELKMKLQSEAIGVLRDIQNSGIPAQASVAAKYLASFEWDKKERGRPSKSELTGELKKAAKLLSEEDEDAKRIGLVK